MQRRKLTVMLLIALFAASALTVAAPTDALTSLPPPPDFQIKVLNITYNVTAQNTTLLNGTTALVFYNRAELELTFNVKDSAQYINNGYYIFYDIRYKDHFEPEWFNRWHTIFDEENYPEQTGLAAVTTSCNITYAADDSVLDFQARTITARLVTHWHYERVQGKWTYVSQDVLEAVTSSVWSNSQSLTGLEGYFPKTLTPSTSPSPTPTPSPTQTAASSLGDGPLGWVPFAVMVAVGVAGGLIILWGVFVWWRSTKT
jgi:hypothetical protein